MRGCAFLHKAGPGNLEWGQAYPRGHEVETGIGRDEPNGAVWGVVLLK